MAGIIHPTGLLTVETTYINWLALKKYGIQFTPADIQHYLLWEEQWSQYGLCPVPLKELFLHIHLSSLLLHLHKLSGSLRNPIERIQYKVLDRHWEAVKFYFCWFFHEVGEAIYGTMMHGSACTAICMITMKGMDCQQWYQQPFQRSHLLCSPASSKTRTISVWP